MSTWSRYASHLDVLESICLQSPPKRVLEFGAGDYSTAFFLGLEGLAKLVSVEVSPRWRARLEERYDGHPRFELRASAPAKLTGYDLIFIDDGQDRAERSQTIDLVLGAPHSEPVVLHDAEEYEDVIQRWTERYEIYGAEAPRTAVIRGGGA